LRVANAEFQHFILRCNKIFLLCGYLWRRIGVKGGPFLCKLLVSTLVCSLSFTCCEGCKMSIYAWFLAMLVLW
jgi:hypothetical protein